MSPYPTTLRRTAQWVASAVPTRLYRGRAFYRRLKWLEASQWWAPQDLRRYQDQQIRGLVAHAYAHVPYYRATFDARGLRPEDVTSVADLHKLPFIDKDTVRTAREDLRSRAVPDRDVVWKSTSGTTGQPLQVAVLKSLLPFDNDAYHWRQFRWGGCTFGDRRATLLAATLSGDGSDRRRLHAYDPRRKTLALSTYDLKPSTAVGYAEAIERYRPAYLMAFPSSAERLAILLRDAGLPCPVRFKAVFLQSESVLPWQRRLIGEYFGCAVYDWYATEERVVNACDCEQHDGLHVLSEFGVVELVKTVESAADNAFEVVATPLHNPAMPLIRYRTGDMAQPVEEPCPCGRGLPRIRLVGGRSRSYAVLATGHLVPVTLVDIPKAFGAVEQFQFVQDQPGAIALHIVRKPGYSDADTAIVHANLREKFGDALKVDVVFVDEIRPTARGKVPLLVQRLDLSAYEAAPARHVAPEDEW